MPTPIPLPLGWNLFYGVQCPVCSGQLYFRAEGQQYERDVYCPNVRCENSKHEYTIRLGLKSCEVVAVKS